jgi:putative Ca2+/H+ antiporter (TMEM165/GDT1 family)
VPDKLDDDENTVRSTGGAFLTTLVSFFLVEMGDKTQIATIALAAHYQSVLVVAAGTTLGMMLVNGPAVFLGEAIERRVSMKLTRALAALLFLVLGLWQLAEIFGWIG